MTRYWMDANERDSARELSDEFRETLPVAGDEQSPSPFTRRDFVKVMGLTAMAAGAAACSRAPVKHVVPFLQPPEEYTPGESLWYASTCGACPAACPVLVRVRDGRPVLVTGHDLHPWNDGLAVPDAGSGGVCATGQAWVLALYDAARATGPSENSSAANWAELDDAVRNGLGAAQTFGRSIRVVTAADPSPLIASAVAALAARYAGVRRVIFDQSGVQAMAGATKALYGTAVVPAIHFERARAIVAVDCDFLGTWISPVRFSRQYAAARNVELKRDMTVHFQLEADMSLSGSNADHRWSMAPADVVPLLAALAARLGVLGPRLPAPSSVSESRLQRLERALRKAGSAALLVTAHADPAAQALALAINSQLGSVGAGKPIDTSEGIAFPECDDIDQLIEDVNADRVGAVIFVGTNPVQFHPRGRELAAALPRVNLRVAIADRRDETGACCTWLAADHHGLESWDAARPAGTVLHLRQPVLRPLHNTRAAVESLAAWSGHSTDTHQWLSETVHAQVWPAAVDAAGSFDAWFQSSLQAGVARLKPDTFALTDTNTAALTKVVAAWRPTMGDDLQMHVASSGALKDGRCANNGWLLELPDPITKICWTNVAAMAASSMKARGLSDGDVVSIECAGSKVQMPVFAQPGVHKNAVCVQRGWGRSAAGPHANGCGSATATFQTGQALKLSTTGEHHELARTQTHHSMEGRDPVHETELAAFLANPRAGTPTPMKAHSLWGEHRYDGHRWAMVIDLNACNGCSGCLVACQAENNVPIVGEDEVRRRREMHWIRIDRYYTGSEEEPGVVHQPMLCQHCEKAPCETVCPVVATVHSSEGLNQQIYNRCVGTRYCANNCPTKVRRFNWFEYPHDEPLERLVLNPDVVVRSRGVMEKCSLCVHRIQKAKADAKAAGQPLADGGVRTACQQSCPAGAIVFGDLNDPQSRVAKLVKSGRSYRILDQLDIRPAIHYQTKVRNREEEGA